MEQSKLFIEVFNQDIALKIVNNWDVLIQQLPKDRQFKLIENNTNYDFLLSLKKMIKTNGINHVKYDQSKNLKDKGRLFAQTASLQNLPREIRGALTYENYYDIDMINAHPVILAQYCKKNDIDCPNLEYYVKNRDQIIQEISNDNPSLNRSDIKKLFLLLMNGGNRYIDNNFLNNFKKEVKLIHTQINVLNPLIEKAIRKRKEYNVNGSITNIILCEIENKLLLKAVEFLTIKYYSVDVLVFDGLMVRKNDIGINQELLNEMSIYVYNKTGYDIKFIEKPLKNIFDLEKLPVKKLLKSNYPELKEEFEQTHLKIIHPPIYICKLKNRYELQSKEQLTQSYEHISASILRNEGTKNERLEEIPFPYVWTKDTNIRKYDSLVFTPPPLIHNDNEFNTWIGFDNDLTIPIEDDKYINQFKDYIYNLIGKKENYCNYLLSWIANIIQYPAFRSQVCIILYSMMEGVGKSILGELIEKIVDSKYTYFITDVSNQLFGKHSMVEYEKLFIVLNEIKGKDTYSNSEMFKQRITDPKRDFEPKGLKAFNSINYANYMCSTNNINSVNVGDNDRRFCVITCNNKKNTNKQYFVDFIENIINNEEAIVSIYHYLKTFPIEDYVPNRLFQKYRPTDDPLYQDLQEYNRDITWNFLNYLIEKYYNDNDNDNDNDKPLKITNKDIWSEFEGFLEVNGETNKLEKMTLKKFHFAFKQKVCQVIINNEKYENAIKYSTRQKKIYKGNDECYVFDMPLLKEYLNYE
jgi:hypothetical protein